MVRDIININDFIVLVEEANTDKVLVDSCKFDEPLIAVAFYGSGNVHLSMDYGQQKAQYENTKGLAISFYADNTVDCVHTVAPNKPLECILIATSPKNLQNLPNGEGELFTDFLEQLVNPSVAYVEGPRFFMTPEMEQIVNNIFKNSYEGKAKMMFFRSQITALLSHFFWQLSTLETQKIKTVEREKLFRVKEILSQNLDKPPSLTQLSRQIGLNTFKLKKDFKELFGVPVFKYLQNERMAMAHHLLRNEQATVQEAAWHVGYDSLSSFSNAFTKSLAFVQAK